MKDIGELFNRPESEIKSIFSVWKDSSKSPFLLNLFDIFDLSEKIITSQKVINSSENPRLIVLETWILIDYTVRHLLSHGLQINRFESADLSFLPLGTKDCILMLEKLIKDQINKDENPYQHRVIFPIHFLEFILDDKDFLNKLFEYEEKFYKKFHPEIKTTDILKPDDPNLRAVSNDWLKIVQKLDSNWFDNVNKINKIRNQAAHSFDENKIYSELGINGKNKISKLKKFCNDTLFVTIGV